MRLHLRLRLRHWWGNYLSLKIAWMLPKRVVMWCFYRVIADKPDPDAGLILQKPIDVIGAWCDYHGIK